MDEKLTDILLRSRYEGGKSQAYIAEEIGVSKKTIQHWEQGISQPTIEHFVAWLKACGVNPARYLLEYVRPGVADHVQFENDKSVEDAFCSLVADVPTEEKRALLYLFLGDHGSSPSSVMNLLLAHLHNPLKDRISIAIHIATHYRLNKSLDQLVGGSEAQPNIEILDKAILAAAEAVQNEKTGYTVTEERHL